jgi:hypothetical protein
MEEQGMRLLLLRCNLYWLPVLLLAGLSACGEQTAMPYPLTCHTTYRPNTSAPIEHEDQLALTQLTINPLTRRYADLSFHAQYLSEQGTSPSLNLFVTLPNSSERLTSILYQLPQATAPANQFVGGHGFTGLHYVYHPSSGAELQFWCVAD